MCTVWVALLSIDTFVGLNVPECIVHQTTIAAIVTITI